MKVFVSYSRTDAEFVARLGLELSKLGYDVWVDTEDMLTGGQARWRRSIVAAIRASDVMLLVLSPNSTSSENVERELSVATENAKRVIPIMYQECELPDGFQYDLAGVQHIDFTKTDFKEAVRQLVAYIGPPHAATPPVDAGVPLPPPVIAATPDRWRQPRVLAIAGATVAALLIGAIVVVAASGGDESSASTDSQTTPTSAVTVTTESSSRTTDRETTAATDETVLSTPAQSASTAPTVATQPSLTEEEQAEAIVLAWADATSNRDWAEAARIDTGGRIKNYDSWYGRLDEPNHMVSIEPYVVSAVSNGSSWTLAGAVMAYDMFPEPTLTTNVACSVWTVDILNGTVAWGPGTGRGKRVAALDPSEFEENYAQYCT